MPVVSLRTGRMSYPRNPSGNMPAVPVPPQSIPGVMISILPMLITVLVELGRHRKWGSIQPIIGAFSICTVMFGNGPQTGTLYILLIIPQSTQTGRPLGRIASIAVVLGPQTIGTFVLQSDTPVPQVSAITISASVSPCGI